MSASRRRSSVSWRIPRSSAVGRTANVEVSRRAMPPITLATAASLTCSVTASPRTTFPECAPCRGLDVIAGTPVAHGFRITTDFEVGLPCGDQIIRDRNKALPYVASQARPQLIRPYCGDRSIDGPEGGTELTERHRQQASVGIDR